MRQHFCAVILAAAVASSAIPSAVPASAQTPAPAAAPSPAPVEIRRPDLFADYFAAEPTTGRLGSVIVLGGSEGGLRGSRPLARRLSQEGFDAIAVSYFGEEGQSVLLDRVPIEPVARAREWLEAREGHSGRIALVGGSKGAELALLAASRDPRINAVVAATPTHLVWQGIDMGGGQTGASWTSAGEPVPYVAYDMTRGFSSIFNLYSDSLPGASPDAEIPVERIAGPVMLISGDADALWPAAEMSRRIEARLAAHGFAYPVVNLVYEAAGHLVLGPPISRDAPGIERVLALGGTVDGLVAARADGWPRMIAFLRESLAAE